MQEGDGRLAAAGFLVVLVFAWGGNYTWVKIALTDVGPWTFNALRYGGAALLLGVLLAIHRGPRELLPYPGERLLLAMIGLLQITAMTGMTAVALQWVEASRVVLIAYSMPVWAMLIGLATQHERIDWRVVVGAALGLIGLLALFDPRRMNWLDGSALLGSGAALLGSLGWALGSVLYRVRRWHSSFWQQVFWQVATCALAMIVIAAIVEPGFRIDPTPSLLAIVVYNCLVPTALGFWCWAQALTRVSASVAGQVLMLAPLFGMLLSHLVLGEPLDSGISLSAACIVGGAWLSLRRSATPDPRSSAA